MPVRVFAGFCELPESYDEFLLQVGREQFFVSPGWFRNLAETALDSNARLRIYVAESNDTPPRPLAMLVTRTPAGQDGSIFSKRWIGGRTLSGMTNYQSIEFAPLVSPEVQDAAVPLRELALYLSNERPRWTLIDLNLLNPKSTWYKLLAEHFRGAGMAVRQYYYAGRRFEPTSGRTFQAYLAERSNNERRGIKRHKRQLEEKHRVRLDIVKSGENLEAGIADYEKVLAASWKKPEPFPRFTAGMMRASAEAGTLRLGLMYVDDVPVATQIWIVSGGKATIYKLHYHEDFKRFSVGSIVTAHLMEHALDVDHVQEVDFGLFDDPHKKAWMTQLHDVSGLAIFNPWTFWGVTALLRHDLGRLGRVIAKSVKPAVNQVLTTIKRLPFLRKKLQTS